MVSLLHPGNSVVTDVQFGHLFLVCIKYVALQEVTCGQFRGDGRTVRTLVFGVYKICCITGSYLWVIQKDITL